MPMHFPMQMSEMHDPARANRLPSTRHAIHVADLRELAPRRVTDVLRQLAVMVHDAWSHCTDEFATAAQAEDVLRRRVEGGDQALFVALDHDGQVAGTGSIARDDFYEGFSRANGVHPGYVGRDLHTATSWRGRVVDGLKIWEHMLEARLRWIARRGGAELTVFTEPGPIDLPALYRRLGAVVVKRGLHHRGLGRSSITMLTYPVQAALMQLAALRHQRLDHLAAMPFTTGPMHAARSPSPVLR